jgi:putative ABC transport system permease protein
MVLPETIFVGVSQLRANKLRSTLTLLGIVIGVASVIGIISIGEGLRRTIVNEFARAGGAGTVLIRPPDSFERKEGRWVKRPWAEYLTAKDHQAFLEESGEHIDTSVPSVWGQAELRVGKTTMSGMYVGTSESINEGYSWPVVEGRSLTSEDVLFSRKVCLIGQKVKSDLFADAHPVGLDLKLNGTRYTVVGVLEERIRFGRDEGDRVFIPYSTAHKRLLGHKRFLGITLFIDDLEAVSRVADEVRRVLTRRHEHGDEFWVETSQNLLEQVGKTIRVMKQVAGGIAGISLLVGGIGIMNIMLVSVTERTREIGVRKALGAKPRHILMQFVAEAVILSFVGGVIGVGIGIGFGLGLEQLISHFDENSPFASVVSTQSIVMALGFSSAVGMFFGVYPAVRASRLDPVEALRHE